MNPLPYPLANFVTPIRNVRTAEELREAEKLCEGIDFNDGFEREAAERQTPRDKRPKRDLVTLCFINKASHDNQESARKLSGLINRLGVSALSNNAYIVDDESEQQAILTNEFEGPAKDDAFSVVVQDTNQQQGFNNIVEAATGQVLRNQKCFRMPTLADFIVLSGNDRDSIRNNGFFDLIFVPIPYVDTGGGNYVSPNLNSAREMEFLDPPRNTQLNPTFWSNHARCYTNKVTQTLFYLMELAAIIPTGLLRDDQIPAHQQAVLLNRHHGSGLDDKNLGFFKLTLFRAYQAIFIQIMNSPCVQAARKAGWRPVLRLKNCQNQKGSSTSRPQMTTRDQPPKSFLHLVGFIKTGKTVNDIEGMIGIGTSEGRVVAMP
jgi:hypothetical protein